MSRLPEPVALEVIAATDATPISWVPVAGGSINQAARVDLSDGRTVFCKWHERAPEGFFRAEADGLHRLAATGTVRVPTIVGLRDDPAGTSVLILDYIDASTAPDDASMADLGRTLAALHAQAGKPPGLQEANFIGSLPQPNETIEGWVEFFVERRLKPLSAALDGATRRKLLGLNFEQLLSEPAGGCSLLHGDLWAGNALTTDRGLGYVIDPAVYAGHPEVDLAMTRLFGGFSEAFYAGYQTVSGPFDAGLDERLDLYNLYPLLVHVNLFGGAYVRQVARTVERFE